MATTGYSGKSLAQKFGVKENMNILFVNDTKGHLKKLLELPAFVIVNKRTEQADMIVFVLKKMDDLQIISTFHHQLNDKGMIWMCWAKKSSPLFNGITEDTIRNKAIEQKLVDIKVCAVDENYSGLKLVRRQSTIRQSAIRFE